MDIDKMSYKTLFNKISECISILSKNGIKSTCSSIHIDNLTICTTGHAYEILKKNKCMDNVVYADELINKLNEDIKIIDIEKLHKCITTVVITFPNILIA